VELNKEVEKLRNKCNAYEDKIEDLQTTISTMQDQTEDNRHYEDQSNNGAQVEALVAEIISLKKKTAALEEQLKSGNMNEEEETRDGMKGNEVKGISILLIFIGE